MKLINADKYKKDIEHYRNTICYQRNVTMDDCMRILDKQEDVLGKIRSEIDLLSDRRCNETTVTIYSWNDMKRKVFDIIDKYKEGAK